MLCLQRKEHKEKNQFLQNDFNASLIMDLNAVLTWCIKSGGLGALKDAVAMLWIIHPGMRLNEVESINDTFFIKSINDNISGIFFPKLHPNDLFFNWSICS